MKDSGKTQSFKMREVKYNQINNRWANKLFPVPDKELKVGSMNINQPGLLHNSSHNSNTKNNEKNTASYPFSFVVFSIHVLCRCFMDDSGKNTFVPWIEWVEHNSLKTACFRFDNILSTLSAKSKFWKN